MLQNYYKTPLEQLVEDLYLEIGVTSLSKLNIEYLSDKLKIWFYELNMGSQAVERGDGIYSICVDRRLPPAEQWEDFLHEVCHVLRHAGDQTNMPDAFREWQENDADAFILYASMPIHLVCRFDLPTTRNELVAFLASEFGVTRTLASKRAEQIQRRVFQGALDDAMSPARIQEYRSQPF